jgi:2-haloacid dehalogenase
VSSPTTPTAVVFDLGGVLIRWDPRRLYRQLMPEDEIDAFLDEVGFDAWNHEQDAGATWGPAVEAHAALFPHRRALLAAYPARFPDSLDGPVEGTVAILEELHAARTRLVALTNWSAELFPHPQATFEFLALFEGIVVSGREGLAKPDPAVFDLLLSRYGLDPAGTVFVDDSQANVAAAAAAGLTALVFTGADRLRADLSRLGLLGGAGSG